ncbi:MAG TPA: class A beta-lactamase-related serine hydrolase [Dehalococcoidia bacterium]|jgi:CubicO group peptidase (beta-lactamase class C family)|nr:class A beta-lactamase-related serine hydrolase [Dehalococcoidia bacterium]HIK89530.1 class A beta-lactamase-related serine hydrolase [Dehalococcoidia bacterium]
MIQQIRKLQKPAVLTLFALPVFAFATFAFSGCSTGESDTRLSPDEVQATRIELQAAINSWREDERITGATMSVYSPATGQIDLASGLAKRSIDPDRFPDEPIAANRPMFVGDLTHVLVAATIIQLAQEGDLYLNSAIVSWFPGIENAQQITIRNLLEHTSGVPIFYTEIFLDVLYEQQPHTPQSPNDVIAIAADKGSFFPPVTQYGYSKTNFLILGRIIELTTGNSLESELRKRFLDPLQMNDTYLAGRESIPGGTPLGYEFAGPFSDAPTVIDGHVPQVPEISVISAEWASGAIVSTPSDIIKLVRAIFESADLATVRQEMLSVADYPAQESDSSRIDSGAGVFTWTDEGESVVGQFGFIYPFSAQFVYWQDSGTVIAVIANEVDSSRNPNSNFQLPVIENLTTKVKAKLAGE